MHGKSLPLANAAAKTQRPSRAAGEAVLLALAAQRVPFVQLAARANGQPGALILGDALRIDSLPDHRLAVSTRDTRGHWRRSARNDDLELLDPGALIERALQRAIAACVAATGSDGFSPVDRRYLAQRLRADLYPAAHGASTARTVRLALCRGIANRSLLRSACLIFGRNVTLADFNDIVLAGATPITRITCESPNLAPLLVATVRRHARKGAGLADLGALGALRRDLAARPPPTRLARRDWKWLAHQPNSLLRRLLKGDPHGDGSDAAALAIRLFCATGVRRPHPVIVGLADRGQALERALGTIASDASDMRLADLARLLRLALAEAARRAGTGQSLRFLRDDSAYLIDWWIDQSGAGAPLVPANATYASLIRRQQRWHQLIILQFPEFLQQWQSALAAHESAGLRAVPLTDSLMLAREGMDMRHCVASYARDCAGGQTRIFALELAAGGERATAELRRRAGTWFAGQLKGVCNAEVTLEMRVAAERLAARYTRAERAP